METPLITISLIYIKFRWIIGCKKRCLRTVRDYSGGASISGLGFCLARTFAMSVVWLSWK